MGFPLASLHRLLSQLTVHCGGRVPLNVEHQYISSSLDHHRLQLFATVCTFCRLRITSVQQYRRPKTAVGLCSATHIDRLS
ncbi:hypothetical protein GDO81_012782 [Engystomops pustulosus]|uniref:Secreted protein n=1 Tax=Engystomops pustulosus TaxID=76066 RepID=A0AAV7AZK1_ENGPU|nr:hypothetical protein GDO81_012782 [Engystomops pustulosus]